MNNETHESLPTHESNNFNEYAAGGGYSLRWLYYEFTDDEMGDFHEAAVKKLGLEGNESVLDVGCGGGWFLRKIKKLGHTGLLVGVDNADELSVQALSSDFELQYGDADEALGFSDSSFDVSAALFMLYHVKSPLRTLREMARVTKDAGKVVVATSGANNKKRHRYFEGLIAKKLGYDCPPPHNANFTTEKASTLLPLIFNSVEIAISQSTTISIAAHHIQESRDDHGAHNPFTAYMTSLKSMAASSPNPKGYMEAIDQLVIPEILKDINKSGAFKDTVDRTLYICSQSK